METIKKSGNSFWSSLWFVLLLVAGLFAGAFWIRSERLTDEKNAAVCLGNLMQMQVVQLRYAVKEKLSLTNSTELIASAFELGPKCPKGGIYHIPQTLGDRPTCSIKEHNQ